MRNGDRVVIGFISPGQVDTMFALRLAALFRERPGRVVDLLTKESSGLLSQARNQLVADFLIHPVGAEWLLMLDTDQQLILPDFDKLCDAADDTERPIAAGLYFGAWAADLGLYPTAIPLIFRNHPTLPHRFAPIMDYPRDQVIPVDSAGTGCLLVHRSVFEGIRAADENPQDPDGRWCWFRDLPAAGGWFSEDHFFCSVARENGYPIHAHTGVVLPHRKKVWLDERHHLLSHLEMLTPAERRSPQWTPVTHDLGAPCV